MRALNLFLLVSALVACDSTRQYEDYQMKTESDQILTSYNHPHGYQKLQCFVCHHLENIHQENRIGSSSFDLANTLVRQSGLASCSGCHGKNGAP